MGEQQFSNVLISGALYNPKRRLRETPIGTCMSCKEHVTEQLRIDDGAPSPHLSSPTFATQNFLLEWLKEP